MTSDHASTALHLTPGTERLLAEVAGREGIDTDTAVHRLVTYGNVVYRHIARGGDVLLCEPRSDDVRKLTLTPAPVDEAEGLARLAIAGVVGQPGWVVVPLATDQMQVWMREYPTGETDTLTVWEPGRAVAERVLVDESVVARTEGTVVAACAALTALPHPMAPGAPSAVLEDGAAARWGD